MISLRIGCGIAALAVGILAVFALYKPPSNGPTENAYALVLAGKSEEAVGAFSRQIAGHPKDYILYLRRGVTLRQLGRHEEALADLTEALRLSPPVLTADELGQRIRNSALPETHRLLIARQLHSERADILLALGRPQDALADLDAAVALNTNDLGTRHHRGVLRTYAGRINDAIEDFDAIMERRPGIEAVIGRANAKYLGGDYAGASEDFAQATKMAPGKGSYSVWLLKAQLRGHLAIPLKQFEGLPKSNPAWVGIDALLADYTPAQMAANLAAGMAKDKSLACEGMVFLGEWLVIRTDGKNAPAIFQDALGLCPTGTMSHAVATLELRRMATAAAAPTAPESTPAVPAILHQAPVSNVTPGI